MWEDKLKEWLIYNLTIGVDIATHKLHLLNTEWKFLKENETLEDEKNFYQHVVDQLDILKYKLNRK
jgi:hypothetical protein